MCQKLIGALINLPLKRIKGNSAIL